LEKENAPKHEVVWGPGEGGRNKRIQWTLCQVGRRQKEKKSSSVLQLAHEDFCKTTLGKGARTRDRKKGKR